MIEEYTGGIDDIEAADGFYGIEELAVGSHQIL